jgi:hypothetical protein
VNQQRTPNPSDRRASVARDAAAPADAPADALPTTDPRLSCAVQVGPGIDPEAWRLIVPARPATYMLTDEQQRPVLLATAGNLRNVLFNRLGPTAEDKPPGRRTDYRAVTRRVCWRPAYSAFEANWALLETGRRLLPDRYSRLIRHWRAYWVHVDLGAAFPRFTPQRAPADRPGRWFGPIPTAAGARRLIEALTDVCDLCRYHEILVKAPAGEACAYKEMGRCPAPCDGTVAMSHYHGQIAEAVGLLCGGLGEWRAGQEAAMRRAAAELAFERAGRIKQRLDRAAALARAAPGHVRPLEALGYLIVQRGRRKAHRRLFIATPGRIALLGELQRRRRDQQIDWAATHAAAMLRRPIGNLDTPAAERIGLVSWHLLRGEREKGTFVHLDRQMGVEQMRSLIADTIGQ